MSTILNILMIEDRIDDAELILVALKSQGFKVNSVRVDTLDAFESHLTPHIDVILADYTLPGFNATDALGVLQNSGFDIPFIVVTGTVSEEIAVACIRKGATDYLLKDRLSRLGEAIRHSIAQYELLRAQRKAEQELIILGRAIETSINGVLMTDVRGVITFVNQAVLDMLQLENKSKVLDHDLSKLLVPGEQYDLLLLRLRQESSARGEIEIRISDGQMLQLQYVANQIVSATNQPLGNMFILVDITEQKKAEALRVALERERELREIKSRFFYMLVHEFRNPLMSTQVLLSVIDQHHNRLSKKQVRQNIQMALEQTSLINNLIDDVLITSKAENVSITFSPQEIDLIEFCRNLFEGFMHSTAPNKYSFSFQTSLQVLPYSVDQTLLKRAINNLLSNAVKYSPKGGLIRFQVSDEKSSIKIAISDEGIGIPPENCDHIFDGFRRGMNVGEIQGSGLGLMIVKQIIEMHHGTVYFESRINQGSTFIILFPQKLT